MTLPRSLIVLQCSSEFLYMAPGGWVMEAVIALLFMTFPYYAGWIF